MYQQAVDPAASAEALKFFDWAYKNGKQAAKHSIMCRCRTAVIAQIEKTWAEIKGPDGKPLYTP